jgi:hypothetical protein
MEVFFVRNGQIWKFSKFRRTAALQRFATKTKKLNEEPTQRIKMTKDLQDLDR